MKRTRKQREPWPLDSLVVRADELADEGKNREAVQLLWKAARAGNLSAQLNLGFHLATGRGVRRSRDKALYWYKRAAGGGHAAAAANVGFIYRDERRSRLALRWFEKAIALGDEDAMLEVAKLCLGVLADTKKAKRLLSRVLASKKVTLATQEEAVRLKREFLQGDYQAD